MQDISWADILVIFLLISSHLYPHFKKVLGGYLDYFLKNILKLLNLSANL